MLETFRAKALDWSRGSKSLDKLKGNIFAPPDIVEQLRRKIGKQAKLDGENNVPPSGATQTSSMEMEIQNNLDQVHRDYLDTYQRHFSVYRERYSNCTRLWEMALIENEEKQLVSDVLAEANNQAGPVFSAKEDLVAKAKELLGFRKKNNLMMRLPNKSNGYKLFVIVLVALVIEYLASIFLMRDAGDLPTLMVLVALFCFANTVAPILIFSHPVKYLFAYQFWKKILGFLCLIGFSSFGFLINFLVGHYRGAVMDLSSTSTIGNVDSLALLERQLQLSSEALNSLTTSFFGLGDIWSWMLVFVNLIIFFYSLSEGVLNNDQYPGYGSLTSDFRERESEYNEQIEQTQDTLSEMREEAIEEIDNVKQQLTTTFGNAPSLKARSDDLYGSYKKAAEILPTIHSQLIMQYRQENTAHRSEPAPEHFDKAPLMNISLGEKNEINQIDPDADQLVARVENYAIKVNAEFDVIEKKISDSGIILKNIYPLRVGD